MATKKQSPLKKSVTRQGLLNISMEKSKEVSPKSQIKDHATSVGMKRKRMDSRSQKALFIPEDRSVISTGKSGADSRAGETAILSEQGHDAWQITQSDILNNAGVSKGTQLPMLTAQSMTSAQPTHILDIELERLSKQIEQFKKSLTDKRAELESNRAKELEEIKQKYNAEIYEAETKYASNVREMEMSRHKVLKDMHLSDAFAFLFPRVDLHYGLSSTSNMQQSTLSTNAYVSPSVLTNCEISTAPRLRPLISNMPPQAPPQVVSFPNHMINLQVAGGDIRAPHPRFRPLYPPAPALYVRPVRADVNGSPSRRQNSPLTTVGSVANTDNRLGLQTPAGFLSANPTTPSGFASARPSITPSGFDFGVAVQAMNGIPPVVAPEVVCLSDDDDN